MIGGARLERSLRHMEDRRRLAGEHGQGMLELRALQPGRGKLRLRRPEHGFRLCHVQIGRNSRLPGGSASVQVIC
jgi:hypothetical protein